MERIEKRVDRLEKIDKRLKSMESTLKPMDSKIDRITEATGRLDAHIDFVTRTYLYLRQPLMFLRNITAGFLGNARVAEVPAIALTETKDSEETNIPQDKHEPELPLPPQTSSQSIRYYDPAYYTGGPSGPGTNL
jgi:hypothetical protein